MNPLQIRNKIQLQYIIKRIAYQIIEANMGENELVLAGISGGGLLLSQKIIDEIKTIAPDVKVTVCELCVDESTQPPKMTTDLPVEKYREKSLVLIDAVLNTGTTLMYGVKYFLDVPLKRFKTAVIVNRNHKKYPVKADFKGLSLSTSAREYVDVVLQGEQMGVYLR